MANHHTDHGMFDGVDIPDLEARNDAMRKMLGATNKFPDGKISKNDEGEIRCGIE